MDALIVILGVIALYAFYRDIQAHREDFRREMKVGGHRKSIIAVIMFVVLFFFDTLGIGSYAPIAACCKIFKITRDTYIAGTLNVASVGMTIFSGIIFITSIAVGNITLISVFAATVIGAYVGAGAVSRLNLDRMRVGIGLGLAIVSVILILKFFGLLTFPGEQGVFEVGGWRLAILVLVGLVFGALMTIGVGIYAPMFACVSLVGMDPSCAFPLAMGSCALLIPTAATRFCLESAKSKRPMYDRKLSLIAILTGWIGVIVAAYFVTSMPLYYLNIIVILVVIYTAATMLYQGLRKSVDTVALAEDAEMESME